ncbi:MAG: hypothetical protein V2B18_15180 [Pseudomonadota bacterium]
MTGEYKKATYSNRSDTRFPSRGLMVAACIFWLLRLVLWDAPAPAAEKERVLGTIVAVEQGRVRVKAILGTFELEPMRICPWCEVGADIVMTFEGVVSAGIQRSGEKGNVKPIPVLVIKDARSLR